MRKLAILVTLAVGTASADVITSTFGPNDSFVTFVGLGIGSGSIGPPAEAAVLFSPTVNTVLTQIRVAVFASSPTNGDRDLVVDLSTGPVPGTPFETFAVAINNSDFGSIYSLDSTLRTELFAGQSYWLMLTSNDLIDNSYGWDINDINAYSVQAVRVPGETLWQTFYNGSPTFEVSGTPVAIAMSTVPEPATAFLLVAGLVIVALRMEAYKAYLVSTIRRAFGCRDRPKRFRGTLVGRAADRD